ncbi:MAG: hypothetical protein K8T20_10290 [Planctomycetes bacterium]|nr:hypothetical protein [Planctomycetota bacterium]
MPLRDGRLFAALTLLSLAAGCASREPGPGEPPFTPATQEELEPVAGIYQFGLGGMRQMEIQEDGDYEETSQGCFDSPPEEGRVGRDEKGFVLRPDARPMERRRMVAVSWGKRRYLLEEQEGAEFCMQVRSGQEPRGRMEGVFFLREGDWNKSATGSPVIPRRWNVFLAPGARFGKVRTVEEDGRAWVTLTMSDVSVGTMVYVERGEGWDEAKVLEANGVQCAVRKVVEGEPIEPGARVVTLKPGE